MKHKATLLLIIATLLSVVLAACGGNGDSSEADSSAAPASLEVTMHDIYYGDSNDNAANPPVWNAPAGGRAQIKAENVGALEHNWAIVEKGATLPDVISDVAEVEDVILFDIGTVAAGASETVRFDVPEAGEYTIICTVAGHYPAMQGKLVVDG